MKTKKITLEIPKKWNYICQQPWGEYMFSVERPVIIKDVDTKEEDFIAEYWKVLGDYLDIDLITYPETWKIKNWRDSLRKI